MKTIVESALSRTPANCETTYYPPEKVFDEFCDEYPRDFSLAEVGRKPESLSLNSDNYVVGFDHYDNCWIPRIDLDYFLGVCDNIDRLMCTVRS